MKGPIYLYGRKEIILFYHRYLYFWQDKKQVDDDDDFYYYQNFDYEYHQIEKWGRFLADENNHDPSSDENS